MLNTNKYLYKIQSPKHKFSELSCNLKIKVKIKIKNCLKTIEMSFFTFKIIDFFFVIKFFLQSFMRFMVIAFSKLSF